MIRSMLRAIPRRRTAQAIALSCVCALALAARARSAPARDDGVDVGIAPGDDFFSYANGDWLKATRIPAGQGRWTAAGEIAERTRRQVSELIDEARTAPAGSPARKVADFRAAYLNEAAIEGRGLRPLRPPLERINRVHDKAGLTRLLGQELRADVDPMNQGVFDSSHILGLAMQAGNHGEHDYVAYLLQGGLGLPDRESYLDAQPRLQALRAGYRAAIERTLARIAPEPGRRASTTAQRADAVMALETAIARSHATPEASAAEHNADTLWTRTDFAREAPGLDWNAFFAAAGLAKQAEFVVWQPAAVKGLAALVAAQPLQAWRDYLRIRVVARHAEVLPRVLFADAMTLHGIAADPDRDDTREQRALEATRSAMSDALATSYVARHFPPAHKARVQAITANVIAAFIRRVEIAPWLSPAARASALAKLHVVYFGVGYSDRWPDDANLVVDPADAVGNLDRLAQRDYRRALARIGQAVDRTEWNIAPQWPGAVLTFHENAYNFAAALLQAPKFDALASDAANYGAIGAIVGHELSHFVDTLGAEYEADGRLHRWWSDDDMARYRAATEPLVQQFSAYRPFADAAVDGKLTLTENLADLGGLVAAFDAYRGTLGAKAGDQDYVRSQDRQFFIGFARAWRAKYTDEALRKQVAGDHAPERYRVSTVRNVDAWYDAFDVKPGQRLYLEPGARIRIW